MYGALNVAPCLLNCCDAGGVAMAKVPVAAKDLYAADEAQFALDRNG